MFAGCLLDDCWFVAVRGWLMAGWSLLGGWLVVVCWLVAGWLLVGG